MASASDDRNGLNLDYSIHQRVLSQFRGDWVNRLNVEQLFMLIDGVLPFEACLYYQVLPLFVEGNRLHLGMVSPDDVAASEYVRRIVSYLNYSLLTHSISSEALRVVLTAYLSHMGSQQPGLRPNSLSYGHHRHTARAQIDRQVSPSERLTLVVDSPDDLYAPASSSDEVVISPLTPPPVVSLAAEAVDPKESGASPELLLEPVAILITVDDAPDLAEKTPADGFEINDPEAVTELQREVEPNLVRALPAIALNEVPNGTANHKALGTTAPALPPARPQPLSRGELSRRELSRRQPTNTASTATSFTSERKLAILNLEANYISSPVEVLAELPPPELLQELLARVLLGGIGRLFFERHPHDGRIVWSQNGVLQSVMDQLPVNTFEGVIQALKTMACTSTLPVDQPRQTEMEYLYDRSRVLLRFRFMPSTHGEEATVQVLRGAAMKFYQQQQISKLEKDAVTIAQQLQNKLNEIRVRAYSDSTLLEGRSKILPRLSELLQHMERELDELGIHPTE